MERLQRLCDQDTSPNTTSVSPSGKWVLSECLTHLQEQRNYVHSLHEEQGGLSWRQRPIFPSVSIPCSLMSPKWSRHT